MFPCFACSQMQGYGDRLASPTNSPLTSRYWFWVSTVSHLSTSSRPSFLLDSLESRTQNLTGLLRNFLRIFILDRSLEIPNSTSVHQHLLPSISQSTPLRYEIKQISSDSFWRTNFEAWGRFLSFLQNPFHLVWSNFIGHCKRSISRVLKKWRSCL